MYLDKKVNSNDNSANGLQSEYEDQSLFSGERETEKNPILKSNVEDERILPKKQNDLVEDLDRNYVKESNNKNNSIFIKSMFILLGITAVVLLIFLLLYTIFNK